MARMRRGGTLSIDVGGSGIKAMVLDDEGKPVAPRVRLETPRPATPAKVVRRIVQVAENQPPFRRVSVGFPGVVVAGVTLTAPNLDGEWQGFELAQVLEKELGRPVRVANDADVQGLGVVDGKGVEMVITLGTGMGSALFLDGRLVPNLELGHHPFRGRKTYEDYVGRRAFDRLDRKHWSRRVRRVAECVLHIWSPRKLYVGGGNAREVRADLPKEVELVDNLQGILGGIRLWDSPEVRS
jgi:polyphosphate glucokinase